MSDIINEKGVKREVKKLLDKHDWFWFMPPANGYGKGGTSDFIGLKNGVFLAIETKFGGNKPTPLQKAFIESIWAQKGIGFAVDEKRLGMLAQWFNSFDNSVDAVLKAGGGDPRQAVNPDDGSAMINATHVLTELLK